MSVQLALIAGACAAALMGLRLTRARGTVTIDDHGMKVDSGGEQRSIAWSNLVSAYWDRPVSGRPNPNVYIEPHIGSAAAPALASLASDNWVVEFRDGSGGPPIVLDGRDFYRAHAALQAIRDALPPRFPRH